MIKHQLLHGVFGGVENDLAGVGVGGSLALPLTRLPLREVEARIMYTVAHKAGGRGTTIQRIA